MSNARSKLSLHSSNLLITTATGKVSAITFRQGKHCTFITPTKTVAPSSKCKITTQHKNLCMLKARHILTFVFNAITLQLSLCHDFPWHSSWPTTPTSSISLQNYPCKAHRTRHPNLSKTRISCFFHTFNLHSRWIIFYATCFNAEQHKVGKNLTFYCRTGQLSHLFCVNIWKKTFSHETSASPTMIYSYELYMQSQGMAIHQAFAPACQIHWSAICVCAVYTLQRF